jgi:uncharacterized protein YukE/ribosomal protein L27
MDVDAVGDIAKQLNTHVGTLKALQSQMPRLAAQLSSSWRGPAADTFNRQWGSQFGPAVATAATSLEAVYNLIISNVKAQENTSDTLGGGASLTSTQWRAFYGNEQSYRDGSKKIPLVVQNRYPEMAWALTPATLAKLHSEELASQSDQLTWWNGLTKEQRDALIAAYPLVLVGFSGLPMSTRQQVMSQVVTDLKPGIPAKIDSKEVEGEIKLKIVTVSGHASATETEYKDGHYTVTVEADASAAKELGAKGDGGELKVTGGGQFTYEFKDKGDADTFFNKVIQPIHTISTMQNETPSDKTLFAEVDGKATFKIDDKSFDIHGDAKASYDISTGDKTFEVGVGAKAGDVATANGSASITVDKHGELSSADLSGEVSGSAKTQEFLQNLTGGKVPDELGGKLTYEAHLDTTDPAVQRDLTTLMHDPTSSATMDDLMKRATVVVQADTTSQHSSTHGGTAASYTTTSSDTTARETWVEDGGLWRQVN